MRIVHRIGRGLASLIVAAIFRTVALLSRAMDAMIGLVGRQSDRIEARLGLLARVSKDRHRQQGRRLIDPISLK